MDKVIKRLAELIVRTDRFTYDLRGECRVYNGVISAYRTTQGSDRLMDLPAVLQHALQHDGIIGAWRNPEDDKVYYDSCRIFTDLSHAIRFAQEQGQRSVYNLNHEEEVSVVDPSLAA